MRNIIQHTKYKNTYNGNLSSFNRIKRGCLVGPDDAVETFKRHGEYEESATQTRHPGY